MALVSDTKGRIPSGNDLETIYNWLKQNEKIEDNISEISIESLRNVMQRLLSVDKGVFVVQGLKDDMLSYSAGSKYFLTNYSIYEDAGEFIGGIIRSFSPDLAQYIKDLLEKGNDPITLLFEPVLEEDMELFTDQNRHEEIPVFKGMNKKAEWFVDGIKKSGKCLLENLRYHPNTLTQLR